MLRFSLFACDVGRAAGALSPQGGGWFAGGVWVLRFIAETISQKAIEFIWFFCYNYVVIYILRAFILVNRGEADKILGGNCMKKIFPRLISAVLTLCLVLSAVAPLMLFASDGDTAKADSYVFRETFSSGSVNTSGAGSDIEKAGGFFAALGGSTYSLDNSTLKYFIASGEKDAYFDVRFNGDTTKKDLTQRFVFSFWVKPIFYTYILAQIS